MQKAENFADYLYLLLPSALKLIGKKGNQWRIFCRVLGQHCDKLKQTLLGVREQAMLPTAPEELLPVIGQERDMPRLKSEAAQSYRTRLAAKRVIAEQAGTNPALYTLMRSFGFTDVRIEPLYLTDADRWAEATVWIGSDALVLPDRAMLRQETDRIKPASALITIGHEKTEDGGVYFGICMESFKLIDMEEA